jgi:hypothetical protein
MAFTKLVSSGGQVIQLHGYKLTGTGPVHSGSDLTIAVRWLLLSAEILDVPITDYS